MNLIKRLPHTKETYQPSLEPEYQHKTKLDAPTTFHQVPQLSQELPVSKCRHVKVVATDTNDIREQSADQDLPGHPLLSPVTLTTAPYVREARLQDK